MSNSGILATKAISGYPLTIKERQQIKPSILATLAIGKHITLTRAERDRLPAGSLAQLAIGGSCFLDPDELLRLPESLRFSVTQTISNQI